MSKPLTIGMPVYNGAKWLREALDSLLGQTFRDFDIVVSDNASTDDTVRILEEYAARDSRIQYHRRATNIGVFRNYDAVFEGCDSTYFKWASGNDICQPTMLERCIAALERRQDAVLAYPTTVVFDAETDRQEVYREEFDLDISDPVDRYRAVFAKMRLNNIMNGVIRTSELRRTSLNQVFLSSDVNMIAELVLLGPAVHVDEPLFLRRMSPESSSSTRDSAQRAEFYTHEPERIDEIQEIKSLATAFLWAFRTPRKWSIRFRAAGHALRRIVWRRNKIIREVILKMKRR